ncbi:MAG: SIS domain-containing protein [Planctomycetota bacterium]|nr:SIS domain-containing protein [Planctomycetota bacterium]
MPEIKTAASNPVTEQFAKGYLARLTEVLKSVDPSRVAQVGDLLHRARAEGRQVLLMGNGGSASTASHAAVDLGKGCSRGREKRFRVICLNDCIPWMTAISNDISYEEVFAEQLRNHARPGDVVIAISGSGNSKNILSALRAANEIGCETVGLSGYEGGKLKDLVKHHILVRENHMGRIEDAHMIVVHILVYGFMDTEGMG